MTQQGVIDAARDFRRNYIVPRAQSWENARAQPEAALREAAKLGLLSFETPGEYGGMGASFRTKQAICEELARGDMAFAFSLVNTQNIAAKLALGPAAQRHRELIESLMRAEVFGVTALSEPGAREFHLEDYRAPWRKQSGATDEKALAVILAVR
jgi:alkylation response protein AidB-like acyl-CoA dehydrogenase